jgi:hypothetical protein
MFQGRSSVLVVINRCVGCWRQYSIAFIVKCARSIHTLDVFTPFYCRHLTRRTGAIPTPNRDVQAAGSIGMPPSVAEGAGLKSASRIQLGRECLESERISATITHVGFSIAPIPRERAFRQFHRQVATAAMCCLDALSVHRGLSGIRAPLHSPASRRCIIGIYHINPFSQDRGSPFEALWSTAGMRPASREASGDAG